LRAGYWAMEADYLPWLRISARLIAARRKTRLYAQEFSYGGTGMAGDEIDHIPSDPKYAYGDFDTLIANGEEAGAALQTGVGLVAERIGTQLR
jgi:hypothetical protein